LCDNFVGRIVDALLASEKTIKAEAMVEELEQQFTALKSKVHDLREYL
jgi:hypothetical protein